MHKEIQKYLKKIKDLAQGRKTALALTNTANQNNDDLYIASIKVTDILCVGTLIIKKSDILKQIAKEIDGKVDYVLFDIEKKVKESVEFEDIINQEVKQSEIVKIKSNDYTIESLDAMISSLKNIKNVGIIGMGNIGSKIALKLVERNINVKCHDLNFEKVKTISKGIELMKNKFSKGDIEVFEEKYQTCKDVELILGCTPGIAVIDDKIINETNAKYIIDVGNGTIEQKAIELSEKKGITCLCLIPHIAFNGHIETIFGTKFILENNVGRKRIEEDSIISGGIIGKRGEIIVDNFNNPKRIIGIADGKGDIIQGKEIEKYTENIRRIENVIKENK